MAGAEQGPCPLVGTASGSSVGAGLFEQRAGGRACFCGCKMNLSIDYGMKRGYKFRQPRSSRGVSGDDPEGGARRGVLRRRPVTVRPGRLGTPPSRHYDLGARSSLHGSGRHLPAVVGRRAPKETEARPRVKNRHGGAPRGERPASWDARRLASAWRAALRHAARVFRRAPERLSALRPPLDSGERSKGAKSGRRKCAAGTRWAV